jgi:hypothetical protein
MSRELNTFGVVMSHLVFSAHIQEREPKLFKVFMQWLSAYDASSKQHHADAQILHKAILRILSSQNMPDIEFENGKKVKSPYKNTYHFFNGLLYYLAIAKDEKAMYESINFLSSQPEFCELLLSAETQNTLNYITTNLFEFLSIRSNLSKKLIPAVFLIEDGPQIFVNKNTTDQVAILSVLIYKQQKLIYKQQELIQSYNVIHKNQSHRNKDIKYRLLNLGTLIDFLHNPTQINLEKTQKSYGAILPTSKAAFLKFAENECSQIQILLQQLSSLSSSKLSNDDVDSDDQLDIDYIEQQMQKLYEKRRAGTSIFSPPPKPAIPPPIKPPMPPAPPSTTNTSAH